MYGRGKMATAPAFDVAMRKGHRCQRVCEVSIFFRFPTHADSSEIGPSHADLGRIGSYQPKPPIHSEIPKKKKKKGAKCTVLAKITKP